MKVVIRDPAPMKVVVRAPGPQGVPGPRGNDGTSIPAATIANSVVQRPIGGNVFCAPLTMDQILPAFSASLALSGSTPVLVGATVATPAFTASYARTPAHAVLTDTEATTPHNVIGTPSSFSSTGTFTKTTQGGSVTFTLTADEGGPSKTATASIVWLQPMYWGGAAPGTIDQAFIKALPSNALASSRSRTVSGTAAGANKFYVAFLSAFGTPTFTFNGFITVLPASAMGVSVTNANSIAANYDVYETPAGVGAISLGVS